MLKIAKFILIFFSMNFNSEANAFLGKFISSLLSSEPENKLMSIEKINFDDTSCLDNFKGLYASKYEDYFFLNVLSDKKFSFHTIKTDKVRGCSKIYIEGNIKGTEYSIGTGKIKSHERIKVRKVSTDAYCQNGKLVIKTTEYEPDDRIGYTDYGQYSLQINYLVFEMKTIDNKKTLVATDTHERFIRTNFSGMQPELNLDINSNARKNFKIDSESGKLVKLKVEGDGVNTPFVFSPLPRETPDSDVNFLGFHDITFRAYSYDGLEMTKSNASITDFDATLNGLQSKYPPDKKDSCIFDKYDTEVKPTELKKGSR